MDKEIRIHNNQRSFYSIQRFVAKVVFTLTLLFISFASNADVVPPKVLSADTTVQASGFNSATETLDRPVDMATGMRSNGKIFVVVAVMTMILIGLFAYLFSLDKKISKLEKSEKGL